MFKLKSGIEHKKYKISVSTLTGGDQIYYEFLKPTGQLIAVKDEDIQSCVQAEIWNWTWENAFQFWSVAIKLDVPVSLLEDKSKLLRAVFLLKSGTGPEHQL